LVPGSPIGVPETETDGTRVVQAAVRPLVPLPTRGSLADIPFTNAAEAPQAVVISRKVEGEGEGDAKDEGQGKSKGNANAKAKAKDRGGRWRDVTAAAFAAEVGEVAKGLIAAGLKPGERLAIMARTSYAWTVLDFAGWAAGLITVPIYPTSSAEQTAWILADSGAAACAVEEAAQARLVDGRRRELPALRQVWELDAGALGRLAEEGRTVPDALVTARRQALTPASTATLIYTSGTTGRPKGCVLTHGNFFAEVDNSAELLYPVFRSVSDEPASTLLFLPLSHVFGRMVAVGCLRARVRLGHAPSIATEDLLADLAGFRPTFLLAIPYVLEKVYNTGRATAEKMGRAASFDRAARIARRYGEAMIARQIGTGPGPSRRLRLAHAVYEPLVYRRIRAALGGRVRSVICGGSPLGTRLAAFYAGAGVLVFEGYGLTETTAAATVTPPLRPRLGTVGWPLPGTAVRIAADGEVLLRGGQIFTGYWNQPGPAAAGDWFATGDLGELDADGYLTITGRKKEIIITAGGKNVAPAPLEDRLRAHPLVGQCMVVGDGRPYVAALITLEADGLAHWQRMRRKDGLRLDRLVEDPELVAELRGAVDEANSAVSRPESIRRFRVLPVEFTEGSGHLTPSMKLKRSAVLRDFAREIEELYAGER